VRGESDLGSHVLLFGNAGGLCADLKRMYNLFARVPSTLDELRNAMAEYVKNSGRELVADQERIKVKRQKSYCKAVLSACGMMPPIVCVVLYL